MSTKTRFLANAGVLVDGGVFSVSSEVVSLTAAAMGAGTLKVQKSTDTAPPYVTFVDTGTVLSAGVPTATFSVDGVYRVVPVVALPATAYCVISLVHKLGVRLASPNAAYLAAVAYANTAIAAAIAALGTMATQFANAVAITGGLITGTRINPRLVNVADAVAITPNADTSDVVFQTNTQAAGNLTLNAPTGAPVGGQKLVLRIKCTNSQALVWNAAYRGSNDIPLPTPSTGAAKNDYFIFMYNAVDLKWDLVGKTFGF